METQKQIHCIASYSFGTTGTHQNLLQDLSKGTHQNLLQDLRKSSTAQNTATKTCDGSLSGKPNKKIRSN